MVIIRLWEGIGNQMFQYAYARELLNEGVEVRLDVQKAYEESFNNVEFYINEKRTNVLDNFRINVKAINVEKYHKYFYFARQNMAQRIIYSLAKKGLWKYALVEEYRPAKYVRKEDLKRNCYLRGYFQNPAIFSNIREELLRDFYPKKKIKLPSYLKKIVENDNCVAVHIRRGDFVKLDIALPLKYYEKAIEIINSKIDNPRFIIFTNDKTWVKKNMSFENEIFFIDEVSKWEDYEQLLIMSKCRSIITANSTFSWWAAWLNQRTDKLVIMPKEYLWRQPELKIQGSISI